MFPIENNKKYFIKDTEITQTENDKFHHKDMAENIISIIKNNQTPFNVAVVGKWGLGKSSLINMVKERLSKNNKDFIVEDINAWKYEKEALKRVLLRKTLSNLDYCDKNILENFLDILFSYHGNMEEKPKSFCEKFKSEWLPILGNALIIYLIGVGLTILGYHILACVDHTDFNLKAWISFVLSGFASNFYIPLLVVLFQQFINTSSGKYNFKVTPPITTTDEYEFQLEKKISEDKYRNKKIVIIVDDLDRLTPNKIVEALDAIKAFVSYKNFVFIVPFDDTILKDAIQKEKTTFNYNEHLTIESDLFLDKLFQHRIYLPSIIQANMPEYAIEMTKNDAPDLVSLCEEQEFESICKEILIHKKVTTPRQAKKIINAFSNNLLLGYRREYNRLDDGTFTSPKSKRFLAKISVLQSDFPTFYSNLFVANDLIDKFLELSECKENQNTIHELLLPYFVETDDSYKLNKTGESLSMFLHKTASVTVENISRYLYMDEDRLSELFGNEFSSSIRDGLTSSTYTLVSEKIHENIDKDIPKLLYDISSNSDPTEYEFCCVGIINLTTIEAVFNNDLLLKHINSRLDGIFLTNTQIEAKHLDLLQAIRIYEKHNDFDGIDKLILNQFKNKETLLESLKLFFERESILSDNVKFYVKNLILDKCSIESEAFNFKILFNIDSLDINEHFETYLSDINMFERLFNELVTEENYDSTDNKVAAFVKLFKKHIEIKNADDVLQIIYNELDNSEFAELLVDIILKYSNKFQNEDSRSRMCMKLIDSSTATIEHTVNNIIAQLNWQIITEYNTSTDDYLVKIIQETNINKILNNVASNSQVNLIPKTITAINKFIVDGTIELETINTLHKQYNPEQMGALIAVIQPAYTANNNSNEESLKRFAHLLSLLSKDENNQTYVTRIADHIYLQNNNNPTKMLVQLRTMSDFKEGIADSTIQKFITWAESKITSHPSACFIILDIFKNEIPENKFLSVGDKIMTTTNTDTIEIALSLLRHLRNAFIEDTVQNINYNNFLVENLNNKHTRKSIMSDILSHFSKLEDIQAFADQIVQYDDITNESIGALNKFMDKNNRDEVLEVLRGILSKAENDCIVNVENIFAEWLDNQYIIILQSLISNIDTSNTIGYLYSLAQITFTEKDIAENEKIELLCLMLDNCDSASISDIVKIGRNLGKVNTLVNKKKIREQCYKTFRYASLEQEKNDILSLVKSLMTMSSFTGSRNGKLEFSEDEKTLIKNQK